MISCPEVQQFFSHPLFPTRLHAATGRKVRNDDYPWTGEGTALRTERNKRTPSNHEYSKVNEAFRTACMVAGVEPSARQASKFRNNKGKAYEALRKGQ